MKEDLSRRFLDVALAVAAIGLFAALAIRVDTWLRPIAAPQNGTSLRVGDPLPGLAGLDPRAAERTVVLALNSRCRFCTESMPVYRELVRGREPGRVRVVAHSAEPEAQFRAYLAAQSLAVDVVLGPDSGRLPVHATPTALVVDRSGIVERIVTGRLGSIGDLGEPL